MVLWDGPEVGRTWAWTHWVKGAAWATMAVFTAALSINCKWELAVLCPKLYESLQCVWARRIMQKDLKSIAFEARLFLLVVSREKITGFRMHVIEANATLSARGEIRRARDVATWLSKLLLLKSKGMKADSVILTHACFIIVCFLLLPVCALWLKWGMISPQHQNPFCHACANFGKMVLGPIW